MPGGPTMLQTLRSAFCVALSFMGGVAKLRLPPSLSIMPQPQRTFTHAQRTAAASRKAAGGIKRGEPLRQGPLGQ